MSKKKNVETKKELTEEEKLQRAKNREKALKESRKKKDRKLKAKAKKNIAKKAEQKAGKKARHKEARKAALEEFRKKIKRLFSKRNRYILIAFVCCVVLGIVFYAAANSKPVKAPEPEKKAEAPSKNTVSSDKNSVSENDKKEKEENRKKKEETEKRELKILSDTGKDTASSVSENLQDIYPHDGGLYIMPSENTEESIKGELMSAVVLKKDEYKKLKVGDIIELDSVNYVILAINKDTEYGTALSMTVYDENEDYKKIIDGDKSFEDYFGYEKLVYGMTIAEEEAQIDMIGGTDYFKNDGYEDDDMIFFAGTALYLPLCKGIDTGVTLYFDKDCELTIPDDTMLKDKEYDYKAYLKGEEPLYPPDLMAAKIETEGDKIKKFNVMFVLPEGLEEEEN